ncbi:MAG: preprotein translocase subunit SecE [Candidatus Hydrogenedentota bacterium]
MATQAAGKEGFIAKTKAFLDEVYVEMTKKVTWPTKDDLKAQTQVTLILLFVMAGIIFVYDKVFEVVVIGLLSLTQ